MLIVYMICPLCCYIDIETLKLFNIGTHMLRHMKNVKYNTLYVQERVAIRLGKITQTNLDLI